MNAGRTLRPEESVLLRFLSASLYPPEALEALGDARVTDMQDGGMGSIRFLGSGARALAATLAEAEYKDSDGVPVSIAVHADKEGQLFELDFWSVDFLP
jgi:hypothetical protein